MNAAGAALRRASSTTSSREAMAGARHIIDTIPLRQIVFSTGAALFVVGFSETIIFAVIDQGLHRPPSFLGRAQHAAGSRRDRGRADGRPRPADDRRRSHRRDRHGGVRDRRSHASSPRTCRSIAVGIVVAGFGVSWLIVGLMTAIQVRTPLRLQGRVSSAADVFISMPQTISIAVGAALIAVVDYRLLVVVEARRGARSAACICSRAERSSPR